MSYKNNGYNFNTKINISIVYDKLKTDISEKEMKY
jgi:hypothetical protein